MRVHLRLSYKHTFPGLMLGIHAQKVEKRDTQRLSARLYIHEKKEHEEQIKIGVNGVSLEPHGKDIESYAFTHEAPRRQGVLRSG
jgi:hypothetical protein